jgi:hypothetical protein
LFVEIGEQSSKCSEGWSNPITFTIHSIFTSWAIKKHFNQNFHIPFHNSFDQNLLFLNSGFPNWGEGRPGVHVSEKGLPPVTSSIGGMPDLHKSRRLAGQETSAGLPTIRNDRPASKLSEGRVSAHNFQRNENLPQVLTFKGR